MLAVNESIPSRSVLTSGTTAVDPAEQSALIGYHHYYQQQLQRQFNVVFTMNSIYT